MPEILSELQRLFLGSEPPWFLLEILLRTTIIYIYTLLLLRWLGSRAIGQLSTVEFLLVIALGSAVGDSMFYPDVPLLHAMLVITLVVVANKALDALISRFRIAGRAIDGAAQEVIRDGVFCRSFLKRTNLGPDEIFQLLRERGLEHLGQLAHVFLESDGRLTIYQRDGDPLPGLPFVPPREIKALPITNANTTAPAGIYACTWCGTTNEVGSGEKLPICSHCGRTHWTPAQSALRYKSVS